ncbi:MAG: hypothetical protein CBC42_01630 [Betaproteobacteria bacterium TMED82]|nr:MAG: hypothetical protein CBC42_01630 [Betaproteobacteria bacterium TMED82]
MVPDFLTQILKQKKLEVAKQKQKKSLFDYESEFEKKKENRFSKKLLKSNESGCSGIIAEMKKGSPSKGLLREDYDPISIARAYDKNGAACLSVLTEKSFFSGALEHLENVRANVKLPLLRKDFIIDDYQVLESFASGADCILLIVGALPLSLMKELKLRADSLGLDCLIEVHSEKELQSALELNDVILGVNNRNLTSFKVDLETSINLRPKVPNNTLLVAESGINTASDLVRLKHAGYKNFLIGESLITASDPGLALQRLLTEFNNIC